MIFTGHIASQLGTEIRWFHVPCCNLDAMDIFRLDVESLYKAGSAAASSCKECSNWQDDGAKSLDYEDNMLDLKEIRSGRDEDSVTRSEHT